MDWTNQKVMDFLELYQSHPCIWDPNNSSHKNKNKVNDAWIDIQNNMGEPCTVMELKKKKESLMSAFRGYKTKIRKSETSGASISNLYQPKWFAYEFMNSFLGTIYKCNLSMNTENNHIQLNEEDSNNSQDDTGDTDSFGEYDASNQEEEWPLRESQGFSSSQQIFRATSSKKRHHNSPELQQAEKQMDQACYILKNVAQPQEEEDECVIFGKLVAKKIRKLAEDRRDLMMIKINQLFYDEHSS